MSEPPVLGGTLADQEAAMRKGKGGMLVVMGALGLALLGGLALMVGGEDEERVYREIGKQVNGLKQGHFDSFWGCALEGANLRDIHTNAELEFQLEARGIDKGRSYGMYLRDTCLEMLTDISPQLDVLIAPDELKADVEAMSEANGKLRSAISSFVAYLDDPELDFDQAKAKPLIQAIARAWYEFKKAHAELNNKLKSKLG